MTREFQSSHQVPFATVWWTERWDGDHPPKTIQQRRPGRFYEKVVNVGIYTIHGWYELFYNHFWFDFIWFGFWASFRWKRGFLAVQGRGCLHRIKDLPHFVLFRVWCTKTMSFTAFLKKSLVYLPCVFGVTCNKWAKRRCLDTDFAPCFKHIGVCSVLSNMHHIVHSVLFHSISASFQS